MAKKVSLILGIVFILAGVLGFISNPIIGDAGYFRTDLAHNLVHLIIGAVFLAFMAQDIAPGVVRFVGIFYIVLAVLGFATVGSTSGQVLGFIGTNGADNWLHLVLGVLMTGLGWTVCKPGWGNKGDIGDVAGVPGAMAGGPMGNV